MRGAGLCGEGDQCPEREPGLDGLIIQAPGCPVLTAAYPRHHPREFATTEREVGGLRVGLGHLGGQQAWVIRRWDSGTAFLVLTSVQDWALGKAQHQTRALSSDIPAKDCHSYTHFCHH